MRYERQAIAKDIYLPHVNMIFSNIICAKFSHFLRIHTRSCRPRMYTHLSFVRIFNIISILACLLAHKHAYGAFVPFHSMEYIMYARGLWYSHSIIIVGLVHTCVQHTGANNNISLCLTKFI